jgi:hypothetical protein
MYGFKTPTSMFRALARESLREARYNYKMCKENQSIGDKEGWRYYYGVSQLYYEKVEEHKNTAESYKGTSWKDLEKTGFIPNYEAIRNSC